MRTIQERLGHRVRKPTMMSTHVLHCGGRSERSPLDDRSRRVDACPVRSRRCVAALAECDVSPPGA